ncbi:nitronate monooxygenase [Bacillus sonorensis]|uniref:nitronate monooxygenase n=1 Tax=Bacillus TaxID=1386 RepID=UPI0004966BC6|nr:nitronate monooxygenase [Bacillus sonorensis]MEC1353722.1 nitronate monooxygenase [Bacillus sonorensis]MEC1427914.1 nitronate monooxygenase [Bacillus sonorensis]MEC1437729.1 nitronate monooxygenase [Bacillus sonorensis]MEC1500093.1 nitronate monooxygenase [Bacillus sonorensis]MEC1518057.1 nitronate monooxygenase [Bacillus sonorensis]
MLFQNHSRLKRLLRSRSFRRRWLAGPATLRLAAAVSNNGGLGSLAAGYLTPEALKRQIEATKVLTSAIFQVNLFIPKKGKTSVRNG